MAAILLFHRRMQLAAFVGCLPLCLCIAACAPASDAGLGQDSDESTDYLTGGSPAQGRGTSILLGIESGRKVSYCGATLVAPDLLLTAAHCIHPAWVGENARIRALLAGQNVDALGPSVDGVGTYDEGFVVQFDAAGRPFHDATAGHDIGMVKLSKAVNDSRRDPSKVSLRTRPLDDQLVGTVTSIVGFIDESGRVGPRKEAAMVLAALEPFGLRMRVGADDARVCSGDSGGATFATVDGVEYLVGVLDAKWSTERSTAACGELGAYSVRVDTSLDFLRRFLPDLPSS